jgi:hypothetical protein
MITLCTLSVHQLSHVQYPSFYSNEDIPDFIKYTITIINIIISVI